ncbi:MAG TPA: glycosyltransferase [Solirubrobacteraceae bacterium]|nr:glycosyltransferase [Solirubrobacteraceae bacterium]
MAVEQLEPPIQPADSRTAVAGPPGPVRVLVLDVAELPAVLDCAHPDGGTYEALWVLAMRDARPLGMVEVPVHAPELDAAELRRALSAGLGERWLAPAPSEPAHQSPALALPRASVVVPTSLGRPEQLLACVRALARLDYPDYEIVVVDNRRQGGAGEEVLARLGEIAPVRVVAQRRPGISAARNAGIAVADGEIVAFTDDDVEVDRGWLRALGERFVREPGVAGVTGMVVPKELETPAQIWFEESGTGLDRTFATLSFELQAPATGHPLAGERFRMLRIAAGESAARVDSLYAVGELGQGANMAFRASALRAAGGFDEALGAGTPAQGGEDLAMLVELLVAGSRLAYEPTAIVHHTHRRTLPELERQILGYGLGFTAMLTALVWRDPRHLLGLARVLPAGLHAMLGGPSTKRVRRSAGFPPHLARLELVGMVRGPLAYLASRRSQRRWRP